MMDAELKSAKFRACLFRILAYFMMVLGIVLLFSPITTLIGYIPLVGGFLKNTITFIIFIAACLICLPIFILAVGVSWVCFHPKVGIAILVVGIIIAVVVIVLSSTSGGGGGA